MNPSPSAMGRERQPTPLSLSPLVMELLQQALNPQPLVSTPKRCQKMPMQRARKLWRWDPTPRPWAHSRQQPATTQLPSAQTQPQGLMKASPSAPAPSPAQTPKRPWRWVTTASPKKKTPLPLAPTQSPMDRTLTPAVRRPSPRATMSLRSVQELQPSEPPIKDSGRRSPVAPVVNRPLSCRSVNCLKVKAQPNAESASMEPSPMVKT